MNEERTAGEAPDLPEPPVPRDADLRQFRLFAIDVQRLLNSETWVLASGDEAKAAMTLWLQAFHQIPAGSLPANDRMLSYLSMAGPAWESVRDHALRGWEMHADGRLYHPVVTERVLEALARSSEYRANKEAHRAKMREWRQRQRDGSPEPPEKARDDHVTITPPSRDQHVTGKKEKEKGEEEEKGVKNLRHTPPASPPLEGLDAPEPPLEAAGSRGKQAKPPTYTREFEAFWEVYPRRTGKLDASRAFQRARKLVAHDHLMAAAVLYAQGAKGKEERFIPHPATWLNQGRWDDQPSAAAKAPGYVPMASNGG